MKPQRREVTQRRGWTRDSNRCRARCLCRSTNHNSTDPFLQQNGIKVDQQSQLPATESQLAQKRAFVDRLNRGDGARADRDASSNEQFKFISRFKRHTLIAECNRTFALEHNSAQVQFVAQAHFTRGGEQSRTKSPMDFQRGCNDFSRQLLGIRISAVCSRTKSGRVGDARDIEIRPGERVCLAILKARDKSFYPILEDGDVKIKKQTQVPSAKFKISKSLGAMNRVNSFNSLCLYHNRIVHEGVKAVATIQLDALINNREGFLRLIGNSTKIKLSAQRCFISGFNFSGSKFAVDFNRCSDDVVSEFIELHGPESDFCRKASK